MDEQKEKHLVAKYPELLKEYGGDPTKTCLAFGFECGDGWYEIIDELLDTLSTYNALTIEQIKEKFGLLRVYISGMTSENFDEVSKIVHKYEERSGFICEQCGQPGRIVGFGWLRTSCKECEGEEPYLDLIKIGINN